MFSSEAELKKRTPEAGIGRKEFIQLLVDEYYESEDIEKQEQVLANLANFAYDPLNFGFLKAAEAVKLFLEVLDHVNPKLVTYGITGITNICLDPEVKEQLLGHLGRFQKLVQDTSCDNIRSNILAILIFLATPTVPSEIKAFDLSSLKDSDNPILRNLLTVFQQKCS